MSKVSAEFVTELTFQYDLKHKNYGMIHVDEPFDMVYDGTITKLRSDTGGYPETIGIFILNVFNLGNAKLFDTKEHLLDTIKYRCSLEEDAGFGMRELIDDEDFGFKEKDKIIFLKSVIIHPRYRKKGVFEELVKSIYITHHSPNSLFILAGRPLQSIKGELEFMSESTWDVWEHKDAKYNEKVEINVGEYFELNTLPSDDEMNEYKLFAKFQAMKMKQFKNTPFFYYNTSMEFFQFLEEYIQRFKVLN